MLDMPCVTLNTLLSQLNSQEYQLVQGILRNGCLKANQPAVKYEYIQKGPVRVKRPDHFSGCQVYLWKKVAYQISPYKRDLASPPDYRLYLASLEEKPRLDEIAELICESVPKHQHYGLIARGIL